MKDYESVSINPRHVQRSSKLCKTWDKSASLCKTLDVSARLWKKRAAERKKLSRFLFPSTFDGKRFLSPSRFKELSCVPFFVSLLVRLSSPLWHSFVLITMKTFFVPVDEERKENRHWGLETNYRFGDKAAEKKNSTFSLLPRREGKKWKVYYTWVHLRVDKKPVWPGKYCRPMS